MCRNERLVESGKEWLKAGGYIDFTADGDDVGEHVAEYLSMNLYISFFIHFIISFPSFFLKKC